MLAIQARMIATSFSIIAFLATLLTSSIYSGASFASSLLRAVTALVLAYVIGRVIGAIMQGIIQEEIQSFKKSNPLPKHPDKDRSDAQGNSVPPVEGDQGTPEQSSAQAA